MDYVKKSASPGGAFFYQIYDDRGFRIVSRTSIALTAAGVVALQGAGEYDSPEVERGIRYLYRNYVAAYRPRVPPQGIIPSFEYLYSQYYCAQAMFQADVRTWSDYWNRIRGELLAFQHRDGKWQDVVGPNYATAMSTLILQIPRDYLPIFQR
jgi:hypothetical protein